MPSFFPLQPFSDLGISTASMDEVTSQGGAKPKDPIVPKPDDMCTIMYTSGTTGDPKGVMMSHKAVVSTIAGSKAFLEKHGEVSG